MPDSNSVQIPSGQDQRTHPVAGATFAWVFSVLAWTVIIAGLSLVFNACSSPAFATPVDETQLPADGVLSIERSGDVWSVRTEAAPSEVKVMDPFNSPICGTNYAALGPCSTVTVFTSSAPCVYVQVDGIPGRNSSDPYVCRGGTPSTTPPTPTTTPSTPTPTTTTPTTAVPFPSPSPSVTSSSTSTPKPLPLPADAGMATPERTSSFSSSAPASPAESAPALADTGTDVAPALVAFALIVLTLGAVAIWGRVTGAERFGSES